MDKLYLQDHKSGKVDCYVADFHRYSTPAPTGQFLRFQDVNHSGVLPPLEPAPKPHVPEAPVSSNVPRGGFGKRVL